VSIDGPQQIANQFGTDASVRVDLLPLVNGGSNVELGNLLTLPVGGCLLYVQPVFVQSSGATKLPTLQKVLVSFGNKIAFEDTLNEALDALFGGDSGAEAGDNQVTPTPAPTAPTPGPTPGPTPSTEPTPQPSPSAPADAYQAALQDAQKAMIDRQTALAAGDWAAYGEADARLTAAVQKLIELGG
jgi:uncharacterized membrane protein (UPF0182 family)